MITFTSGPLPEWVWYDEAESHAGYSSIEDVGSLLEPGLRRTVVLGPDPYDDDSLALSVVDGVVAKGPDGVQARLMQAAPALLNALVGLINGEITAENASDVIRKYFS